MAQNSDELKTMLTEILNRLDQGFREAADDRQAIRDEMARGFEEARQDRQAIRDELTKGLQETARGFEEARQDRQAIRENIDNLRAEMIEGFEKSTKETGDLIRQVGNYLNTKLLQTDSDIGEFRKSSIQAAQDFETAMRKHRTKLLELDKESA